MFVYGCVKEKEGELEIIGRDRDRDRGTRFIRKIDGKYWKKKHT